MRVPRDKLPRLKNFARSLRRESTDAERRLWSRLRDRGIEGFKFRRQVPVAGYILDFYCVKAKLVIEVDGGQHEDPSGTAKDQRRDAVLESIGMRVLRFSDVDVLRDTDAVLEEIYRVLSVEPSS